MDDSERLGDSGTLQISCLCMEGELYNVSMLVRNTFAIMHCSFDIIYLFIYFVAVLMCCILSQTIMHQLSFTWPGGQNILLTW